MSLSIEKAKQELSELLSKDKLCIFAGSGISVRPPSCLPTWDGFVKEYINICKPLAERTKLCIESYKIVKDAESYVNKDVLRTVSALKIFIKECNKKGITMDLYNEKLVNIFSGKKPNDYHKKIINTNYKYILTSNYDLLLEKAAEDKHANLVGRSYTYTDLEKISEAIYEDKSAIIHIHGLSTKIILEEFILTSDDYKSIKDKNPGFRTLMNSIFMSYSVLFVGYGASDPHLEDIIEDINYNLKWHNNIENDIHLPTYYLILKEDKCSPILEHIKREKRTKIIPIK